MPSGAGLATLLLATRSACAAPLIVDCDRGGSLVAARDALRQQRLLLPTDTPYPHASVEVRGRCRGSLELSGALDAHVSWSGHGGALHSGGLPLPPSALEPVSSAAVKALLPAAVHTVVQQVNLTALGLNASDMGTLRPHHYPGGDAQINFFLFEGSGQAELFWNGEPLHLARYPNSPDDQLLVPQNSMRIASVHRQGNAGVEVTTIKSSKVAGLAPSNTQLKRWADELAAGRPVWAHGEFSGLGWADVHKPIVGVNASTHTVSSVYNPPNPSNSEGRSTPSGWFKVYNLLSELDTAGEYIIGEFQGSLLLLVYPPSSDAGGAIEDSHGFVLSMEDAPVLHVHDTAGVSFAGIDIEYGRSWGAVIDNCNGCEISNCRIANFGINAVNVTGGSNFKLRNAEVTGTGQGGVIFEGGDRQTLTPANHTIQNCSIHRFARIMQKYCPGVCLTGVGHSILNSSLFDGAHFGMLLTGNDHTIRGNHFHNLVYGGADAGAIYSGRDWTYRGQLIESNLFENISSYLCQPEGAANCLGQAPRALHSDDGMSGWTVIFNHFRNVTQVQNAYSSRDITFMHNTIEHVLSNESLNENQLCAIHLDVMSRACTKQRAFLQRVPYNCSDCAWAGRYPHLNSTFLQDDPWLPKYWRLENNTYCGTCSYSIYMQ